MEDSLQSAGIEGGIKSTRWVLERLLLEIGSCCEIGDITYIIARHSLRSDV